LPLSDAINPDTDGEVKLLLEEVEQRASTANVSVQIDPFAIKPDVLKWWSYELTIDSLPSMKMFTPFQIPSFDADDFPLLYVPGQEPLRATLAPLHDDVDEATLALAREYTYETFNTSFHGRMEKDKRDFLYLFLPAAESPQTQVWEDRRAWMRDRVNWSQHSHPETTRNANARAFGKQYSYPDDIAVVRANNKFSKLYEFVSWRTTALSEEEAEAMMEPFGGLADDTIEYPVLVVRPFHRRTNFLVPRPPGTLGPNNETPILVPAEYASIDLISREDYQYSALIPSVLRWLANAMTVVSLRDTLFMSPSLQSIPLHLLTTALLAPAASETANYQRLETLGDCVLKYLMGIQLFAEHPLWHEGYLSRRKDHAVSNNRLAKEAIGKGLYRWIIRDRFVPKKWTPRYLVDSMAISEPPTPADDKDAQADIVMGGQEDADEEDEEKEKEKEKQRPRKKVKQSLSTKVLADVVESLIGASYEHGGFDVAVDCAKLFGMGLPHWDTVPRRIEAALTRVEEVDDLPSQLSLVERMIGYQFTRKMLLVEALTHATYQGDLQNVSYERLEFLGDSALDMVVTEYLYHAPGKNYTPGQMHLRKQALVNQHFLAYTCLETSLELDASMPTWTPNVGVKLTNEAKRIHLWQCLLHSSPHILEEQSVASNRHRKTGGKLRAALTHGQVFPWAALTNLLAPKFISDMVESLLGAVLLDSHGNLDTVRSVMQTLGMYQVMERMVNEDVDVMHPISRLAIWAAKQDPKKKLKIHMEKVSGHVSCTIFVDEEEISRATEKYRGKVAQNNVRFVAAEDAIRKLHIIEEETLMDLDEVGWPDEIDWPENIPRDWF